MESVKKIGDALGTSGLIVLGILAIVLLWGLIEPYFLNINSYEVEMGVLPQELDGVTFAQVSDWQIGMWGDNEYTIRKSINHIIENDADFAVITGDFIYHALEDEEKEITLAADYASDLVEAGIPVYAVLGNHDYALKSENSSPNNALAMNLSHALENVGVIMLENEAVPFRNTSLYIGGIGSHWADNDNATRMLSDIPNGSPRVILMHHPDSFALLPNQTAPLAVAGHTHGGQMRIPFLSETSWLIFVKGDEVHSDGWIEDYGGEGNNLYVNIGIGFSTVPIRINAMPEVSYFELRNR